MENLLSNGLPVPIANKNYFDDCIVEGINTTITNTEIVNDWDTNNHKKIMNKLSVCQNEEIFEDVLNDYILVLKEQALNFKEKSVLKARILRHIKVFYMYYSTNDGIRTDMCNYLDQMEKILIVLCNLELEVVCHIKRKEKDYSRKIKEVAQCLISILSIFMLHRERSILHVLLKLDSRRDTPSWKDVMHIVYRYYLITLPVDDQSDECFCRNYLLFQRWKSITDEKKHMGMDNIMYFRFSRSPESIARSRTLRTILSSSAESIVDVVDVLTDGRQTAVDAYFKHVEQKDKEDEMCLPPSINLDSDEEEDRTQTLQFESQPTDAHDGAAENYEILMDVISDEYSVTADNEISNGILNNEKSDKSDYQPYITDGDIMLVHNVNKGDGMYNKFSLFKKVSDVDEAVKSTLQTDQHSDANRKASLLSGASSKRLVEDLPVGEAKKVSFPDSYKIQASIQMNPLVNKSSLKKDKLNGENNKIVHVAEKIIFTSNERVSSPVLPFAQFELVEKALSGPIEPINSKRSINSDNSNSHDSFYLFESNKSSSAHDHVHNSLLESPEGSLISPPYEDIHALEKHILTVNSGELVSKSKHAIEKEAAMDENKDNKMLERRENRLNNTTSTNVQNTKIMSIKINKRRHNEGRFPSKQPRVSPNTSSKLPENCNGSNSLHSVGLSVLNSRSKQVDIPSASSFPSPTSYASPAVTLFNSARELEDPSFVGKVEKAPNNSSQHHEESQSFSNDKFSELLDQDNAEILNLSVSSKASAPSDVTLPKSEFSRSPKLFQSPDQIVQHCLMDNILENNDSIVTVNNNITFLSDSSNFYSTSNNLFKLSETELKSLEQSQSQPDCVSNSTINKDNFKSCVDDDLLLKCKIDKLLDEKKPLKKRSIPVINVKSQIKTDEISYPATPMICIAELEALQQNGKNHNRSFNTPAERKEMPPLPVFYNLNTTDPNPIITDQFNINNHTINYHRSNVPVPFINVPPILLPFNNIHTFESANVNQNPNSYNSDSCKSHKK